MERHVASEVRGCDESHNGRWENHRSGKGALTFQYPFILRSRANQHLGENCESQKVVWELEERNDRPGNLNFGVDPNHRDGEGSAVAFAAEGMSGVPRNGGSDCVADDDVRDVLVAEGDRRLADPAGKVREGEERVGNEPVEEAGEIRRRTVRLRGEIARGNWVSPRDLLEEEATGRKVDSLQSTVSEKREEKKIPPLERKSPTLEEKFTVDSFQLAALEKRNQEEKEERRVVAIRS
jgi:hypothetical protein